jgi:glycosyltransferase involved in cell wall biosynthesis
MLSILIPTYNYDCSSLLAYLKKQVQNVSFPIEIILGDDASTNEETKNHNWDFCKKNDIAYLENHLNLGRTATRNVLANKASYNHLLFLDADTTPCYTDYISKYETYLKSEKHAVIGGVNYHKSKPEKKYLLRWKFGHKREARSAQERNKHPYLLASANLLITKNEFLLANSFTQNEYGLDALFGHNLKENHIQVLHIDNPVYHLGLETNEVFLNKSLKALKTILILEREEILPQDHTRLQKLYGGLAGKKIISMLIGVFRNPIKKNLLGPRPSLFLFDLYRLYHYIKLKSNA